MCIRDSQYTVQLRGIVDGEPKRINRIVTSVADAVDAYGEYQKLSLIHISVQIPRIPGLWDMHTGMINPILQSLSSWKKQVSEVNMPVSYTHLDVYKRQGQQH